MALRRSAALSWHIVGMGFRFKEGSYPGESIYTLDKIIHFQVGVSHGCLRISMSHQHLLSMMRDVRPGDQGTKGMSRRGVEI